MRKFIARSILTITCLPGTLFGADLWSDGPDFNLYGFGTLGASYFDDDLISFRRDLSHRPDDPGSWSLEQDSLLGLQIDATLSEHFSVATQLVAKKRPTNSLADSVEWAYGSYQATPDTLLRMGRLGFDVFFLSDHRNVGFAYLWARPPVDFYGVVAFDAFDGIDLTRTLHLEQGTLYLKAFGGVTGAEFVISGYREPVYMDISPLVGVNLLWETRHWRTHLGFASLTIDNRIDILDPAIEALNASAPFWPEAGGIAEDLDAEGRKLRYYSAGVAFDSHPWLIEAEASLVDSEYSVAPSVASTYASVAYRIDGVTLYGLAGLAKPIDERTQLPAPPPVPELQALVSQVQLNYDYSPIDQHSLSAGVRWDIRHNIALKLQWDHSWVKSYGGGLLLQQQPLTSDHEIDVFSIIMDFVF